MYCAVFCREYNKKHVKKERSRQRAELIKAWKFLDVLGEGRQYFIQITGVR